MFSSAIISFSFPYLSSVYIDFMTQSEVNCLSIFHLLSQREAREPAFRCFVSAGFLTPRTALNYCLILVQIMQTAGWDHGEYEWDGQWSSWNIKASSNKITSWPFFLGIACALLHVTSVGNDMGLRTCISQDCENNTWHALCFNAQKNQQIITDLLIFFTEYNQLLFL